MLPLSLQLLLLMLLLSLLVLLSIYVKREAVMAATHTNVVIFFMAF